MHNLSVLRFIIVSFYGFHSSAI